MSFVPWSLARMHSLVILACLIPGMTFAASGDLSLIHERGDLPEFLRPRVDAIGVVKVYPFKKADRYIQCTAAHIGDGVVLTAGHCFLGSYDCNRAEIEFGIPSANTLKAKCVKVLKTEAAASAYNSSRYDYALFEVDPVPNEFFSLRSEVREPELGESLTIIGYPRLTKPRNVTVMARSTNCQISSLDGVDFFGRPRAKASVLHKCPSVAGMNGALIFSSETGEIVAIQQAGHLAPILGEKIQSLTAIDNVAQSIKRLSPIESFNIGNESLTTRSSSAVHEITEELLIRIGSTLAEAFPLGIAEPLGLNVGEFRPSGGLEYLNISVRVGAGTVVRLVNGDGRETAFDGYGFFEETLPQNYKGPVKLTLETDSRSQAFSALIRMASSQPDRFRHSLEASAPIDYK